MYTCFGLLTTASITLKRLTFTVAPLSFLGWYRYFNMVLSVMAALSDFIFIPFRDKYNKYALLTFPKIYIEPLVLPRANILSAKDCRSLVYRLFLPPSPYIKIPSPFCYRLAVGETHIDTTRVFLFKRPVVIIVEIPCGFSDIGIIPKCRISYSIHSASVMSL